MKMKNPCHPGRILKESIIEGLGITITEAAKGLGVSRKQLSAIMNERASISPEMALRLEKGVGSSAEQWMRMQMAYDLAKVEKRTRKLKVCKLKPAA
jgi:addiction module HigA family antidote